MGACQLTAEYRKQGFSQALEMAQKLVALESQDEEASAKRDAACEKPIIKVKENAKTIIGN